MFTKEIKAQIDARLDYNRKCLVMLHTVLFLGSKMTVSDGDVTLDFQSNRVHVYASH